LQSGYDGVVSIGGGGWIELANRRLLRESGAMTVWLDAPFEVCWQRIETAREVRPMAPTKDKARTLFEQRQPIYRTATIRVATGSDDSLESLVARVRAAIESA